MSEFQYYEFQKLDGPLNIKEIEAVKKLSSRARVAGNRAVFVYHYGDFKGEPEKILARYFDSMLYIANWGTKRLAFRLPLDQISLPALSMYECEDAVSIRTIGDSLIVTLQYEDEEGFGWVEEDDISLTLSTLQGLRQSLLQQDYRCLYLAWLTQYQPAEPALDDLPIPAELAKLSSELVAFAEFFDIDAKAIKAAAAKASQIPCTEAL